MPLRRFALCLPILTLACSSLAPSDAIGEATDGLRGVREWNDGLLGARAADAPIVKEAFDRWAANDARGVDEKVACPSGHRPRAARAACNLETTASDGLVAEEGTLRVVRRAGGAATNGACSVATTRISEGSAPIRGFATNYDAVRVTCHEEDRRSGGDCRVRGELSCEPFDGALFEHKLKINDDERFRERALQSLWPITEDAWLVTQDDDGRNGHARVRFSLLRESGSVLRRWVLGYDTHGSSLHVVATPTGFDIYTANSAHDGFVVFAMNRTMDAIGGCASQDDATTPCIPTKREVSIRGLALDNFAMDFVHRRVVTSRKEGTRKTISVYEFDDFLRGRASLVASTIVTGNLGPIQSLAIDGDDVFLLCGGVTLDGKKTLRRLLLSARATPPTLRTTDVYEITAGRELAEDEGATYEPEGLQVVGARLVFTMCSATSTRLYGMSKTFWRP